MTQSKVLHWTATHWGYIGIIEKKMETTITGLYKVLGLGLYRDNGKEYRNYHNGVI